MESGIPSESGVLESYRDPGTLCPAGTHLIPGEVRDGGRTRGQPITLLAFGRCAARRLARPRPPANRCPRTGRRGGNPAPPRRPRAVPPIRPGGPPPRPPPAAGAPDRRPGPDALGGPGRPPPDSA